MRRPLMVVALNTAVTALVASVAMAVGPIGAQPSGPTMMRGDNSSSGAGWHHTWHGTFIAMEDS